MKARIAAKLRAIAAQLDPQPEDCAESHRGPFVDYGRKRRCDNCGAIWRVR